MILPTGLGMGAIQLACAVTSSTRAAGFPSKKTVNEPFAITPGPAGTQLGNMQGSVELVIVAAGLWLMRTEEAVPAMIFRGIAGWGTGVGTGAAGWIGA